MISKSVRCDGDLCKRIKQVRGIGFTTSDGPLPYPRHSICRLHAPSHRTSHILARTRTVCFVPRSELLFLPIAYANGQIRGYTYPLSAPCPLLVIGPLSLSRNWSCAKRPHTLCLLHHNGRRPGTRRARYRSNHGHCNGRTRSSICHSASTSRYA
jgi:hypothetical protein